MSARGEARPRRVPTMTSSWTCTRSAWASLPAVRSRRASSRLASTRPTTVRAFASRAQGAFADARSASKNDVDAATLEERREKTRDAVEAAWREGEVLDKKTADCVIRTVRGTIAVARHYERVIDQQRFHFGKYGCVEDFPDVFADPTWVASRLRMVHKMTGIEPESVPEMVQMRGAGVLSLTAKSIMKTVLELKKLVPNADVAHMCEIDPDLLVVGDRDLPSFATGGSRVLNALRDIPMPEPCVRLLIQEEPGLLLGKGGVTRLDQIRETADEHRENLTACCESAEDDGWLDVDAQRWFTNVFCGSYSGE